MALNLQESIRYRDAKVPAAIGAPPAREALNLRSGTVSPRRKRPRPCNRYQDAWVPAISQCVTLELAIDTEAHESPPTGVTITQKNHSGTRGMINLAIMNEAQEFPQLVSLRHKRPRRCNGHRDKRYENSPKNSTPAQEAVNLQ